MSDIFLSYNRQDQEIADLFVRGFEAAGLKVWWDVTLRAGEVYDEVTENALRSARAVVVLWSQRAVASRWVRAEATLAQRLGTFVPCMIEPCERPIMFELTQTADLAHWRGDLDDRAWQAFLGHVRDVVQPRSAPAARPEPVKMVQGKLGNERRQVTFFAGEIADGQRMASALDPEDWHELLTGLSAQLDPIVAQLGGSLKWSGHRFETAFGYPVAQEDAARRASQAGLNLIGRTAELALVADGWPGPVTLRIGVHTGDVLVTITADGQVDLFGDGATTAAQLRDMAAPGQVLVSEAVRQLAGRSFELESVFEGSAAGKVYAVSRAAQRTTTHSLGSEVATHFVGREDELLLIASRWRRARDGSSQLVLVRGEPGIGKTRLVEEFHAGLAGEDHAWLVLQGSSMFPNTPYHALEQMVQTARERGTVEPNLRRVIEAATLLYADPEGTAQSAAAEQQRSRQQAALLHAVFELSEVRPLVMLIDDLQWIDPSTLEFIEMLVEQADQDRILFLATARPEFAPPWPEQEHHSRLTLGRLGQEEIRRLVEDSLGAQLLPAESVASLVERADGVPLFAEELARMFAGGQGDSQEAVLPSTLRALLVARMDRLGGARELLQIGSVLGRSFTYELLQEVAGAAENELVPQLGVLTDEQLLIGRGRPPHVTYRFKHALLQDAAYETLPKKRQRELHRLAAEAIVARFPDMAEGQRELLASHWSRAGAHAEAIAAWIAAGDAAFARAASKEAIAHFKAGIELAGKLAEGADRDTFELDLWSKLNRALQLARGYADPETVAAARKSVELATKHGALAKIIMEEAQFWRSAITAGDYHQADEIAEKLVGMADRLGPDNPMPWVDYFAANSWIQTGFYSGRIAQFEEHWAELEQMLSDSRFNHSANDDVVAIGVGSLAAWMGGRSDLARQRIQQAIDLAEGANQPYAVAVAHHFAGTLTAFERDRAATQAHSRKAVEVCEANGYEYIRHLARAKLGWAGAADDISMDDIESMRQALERMIESNALVGMILNMNRLAIALEGIGQTNEALEVAERALVINPQERVARPQTFEIRGRLFEALGQDEQALLDYREGIELARETGTLALELTLAIQLARLLLRSGKCAEALATLNQTIERCPPLTNSPDFEPAKALAVELRNAG